MNEIWTWLINNSGVMMVNDSVKITEVVET